MDYTIFVVDDVQSSRYILEASLKKFFNVESFADGYTFLERLATKVPNLILLDVDMPEIDGYTLCKEIKANDLTKHIPVIFISGLDDLESKITGYDAGGHDFIIKPCSIYELKSKIDVLRNMDKDRSSLLNQMVESEVLTNMVMSNLDEYTILIKFLRSLNSCNTYSDVSLAMRQLLQMYNLQGAVQYRLPGYVHTFDNNDEASPLEASIISHVKTMGFKQSLLNL